MVNIQPPNTRVQRTRSSPLARHSPLTRRPLDGRRALGAALALLLASSCVTIHGKFYPGWKSNAVSVAYEPAGTATGATSLTVRIVGKWVELAPLSLSVAMSRVGDSASPIFKLYGSTNPAVFDSLPAGLWDLEITISGASRSARCHVDLKPGQVCKVEVVIIQTDEVVVASAAV